MTGSADDDPAKASQSSITNVLGRLRAGEQGAFEELVPLVYEDLRRFARIQMRSQRSDHTLQATALVHEAIARLDPAGAATWQDRVHFFSAAARAMRCVLVDYARRKNRLRRRNQGSRVPLEDIVAMYEARSLDLLSLDASLKDLAAFDPELARVIELRFFGGLEVEPIAEILGVSTRTVERDLRCAKAWLRRAIG